jgi:hypothetical protein
VRELERLLPWNWKVERLAAAVDAWTPSRSDDACSVSAALGPIDPIHPGDPG